MLLSLHMIEIFLWAIVYLWFSAYTHVYGIEDSLYFSLVTFTTVGYGDIVLPPDARMLSGIEAMNGIFLFGWSTALFFAVVQRGWMVGAKKKKSAADGGPPDDAKGKK